MRFVIPMHLLLASALSISFLAPAGLARADRTVFNLSDRYAQTSWPAGHRDSANSDYVPLVMSRANRIRKRLLEGHPIFWPPSAGLHGRYYVSSGKGPGYSNLHAFDSDGNLLWQAPPQQSVEDLDSYAIINAPVVDAAGRVYVGDVNQLWAFEADGAILWTTDLTQYGVDHGFMSVVLSKQGWVGGISSNGKLVFLKPEDGSLAVPVLDLPGGHGPPAQDTPPGDLWKDLMDPAIKPFMFNLIQGWEMEVANTPALHPETGRIYITAAGIEAGTGVLYGIDVRDDRLEIAFEAAMGGGSGTSPAISHDGRQVYALDEAGHMVAVDAVSGERLWQTEQGGGGSASPSVGPDGTIYTAFQDHMLAFGPDGSLAWQRSYNDLAARQVPPLGWFWGLIFSQPVAFIDSLFTVGEREGWLNIVCGYHIRIMPSRSSRTLVPIPLRSVIVAIDLESGEPLGEPLVIPETSEGFVVPTADGNTFVTLSGAIGSIFYHMLNPILPARFKVPHEPRAGLLLLEPQSHSALWRDGLEWLALLVARAADELEAGRPQTARASLRRGALQLGAAPAVLGKAVLRDVVADDAALRAAAGIAQAERRLRAALSPSAWLPDAERGRSRLVDELKALSALLAETGQLLDGADS